MGAASPCCARLLETRATRGLSVHTHRAQLGAVREDLAWRAVKGKATLVKNEDAPAVLGEGRHLLLDDHDGDALALVEGAQGLEDHLGGGGVERGGGLVEHEHAGAQGQHGCDGDLLLLAPGERGDLALAQLRDAHGLERGGEAGLYLAQRRAEVLKAEEQLVLHDGRHHLRVDVLVDAAHHTRDVRERDVAGVEAVNDDGAKELSVEVVGDGAGERRRER